MNTVDPTSIFLPILLQNQNRVKEQKKRFVHYCPAEAALSILKNREIWLRNARCMNDWDEVQFGIRQVSGFFRGEQARAFWQYLKQPSQRVG